MPAWCFIRFLCLVLAAAFNLSAGDLPLRIYTTEDGLVRNWTLKIKRDSRGYLWIGTVEGLSLFDGYQFKNYTVADGLPSRAVNDILETRSGQYWIATNGGLSLFDPAAGARRFTKFPVGDSKFSSFVNSMLEDEHGRIWCATEHGLWRVRVANGRAVVSERIPLPSPDGNSERLFAVIRSRSGAIWTAGNNGVYRLGALGRTTRLGMEQGLARPPAKDILQDRQGRIWAATIGGVCEIEEGAFDGSVRRCFAKVAGSPSSEVTSLFESADGKLWLGMSGLYQFDPDAPPAMRFRALSSATDGLIIESIAEDLDRNLWAGMDSKGIVRISRGGFTRFSTVDGLRSMGIQALTGTRAGTVRVITCERQPTICELRGEKFACVDPWIPPEVGNYFGWAERQTTFEDHLGEWWVPTGNGLLHYPRPASTADLARSHPVVYNRHDGLASDVILRLFEDSRGDVWIGVNGGLSVWRRQSQKITVFSVADGLQYAIQDPPKIGLPQAIAEDAAGQVWIGFHPGGLARYRGGEFDFFTESDGLPAGTIAALYADRSGRLWIGSMGGGAARLDDVHAKRPAFRTYTKRQGLSSDQVFGITGDRAGRVYIAAGGSLDAIEPETGHMRHFKPSDGLPPSEIRSLFTDGAGAIWLGSAAGLSRYVPKVVSPQAPNPPLIRGVRIAGVEYPVSDLGVPEVGEFRLRHSQNNVVIEYSSLCFRSGEVVGYQHRLDGADRDWSPVTDRRTVQLSHLAPGKFRFRVRSINGDRLFSAGEASVGFVILPPWWRSWWFVSLACALAGSGLYVAHRIRLQRLLAIERIRSRLASDLHDEIGSGLVEIAVTAEVATLQRKANGSGELSHVATRARELRQSMADIVWCVDPRRDHVSDVVSRIREAVYSMLESDDRRVVFNAPDESEAERIAMPPECRRELLLFAKEVSANIQRHANASEVRVDIRLEPGSIWLEFSDNGRGFDATAKHGGMGLSNLRRRAKELGGKLAIDASPGAGSRVSLWVPLA